MQQIYERLTKLETETKAQTKILTEICRDNKRALRGEVKTESRLTALETRMKIVWAAGAGVLLSLIGVVKGLWK